MNAHRALSRAVTTSQMAHNKCNEADHRAEQRAGERMAAAATTVANQRAWADEQRRAVMGLVKAADETLEPLGLAPDVRIARADAPLESRAGLERTRRSMTGALQGMRAGRDELEAWEQQQRERRQTAFVGGVILLAALVVGLFLLFRPAIDWSNGILRTGDPMYSVALSPDQRVLAAGSEKGEVWLWRPSDGKHLMTIRGHDSQVTSLAFSHDGRVLASGSYDRTINLFQASDGALLRTMKSNGNIYSIAFSPDGRTLAAGLNDGRVELWNVDDGRRESRPDGLVGSNARVFYSSDGQLTALGSRDAGFAVLQVGKTRWSDAIKPESFIYAMALSPGGRTLAVGANDVKVIDMSSHMVRHTLPVRGGSHSLAFSPGGELLADGSLNGSIRFWNVLDGTLAAEVEGHEHYVEDMAFSSDGRVLVSASYDGTVRLWPVGK